MYSLVRRFIKTAVIFLGVGLAIGLWIMVRRELYGQFAGPYEVSAHTHAILVGFVMMMILGVALWMFPRPARDDVQYKPALAEASYWLVMIGTAGRIVGELVRPTIADERLRWALVLCGVAQVAGIGVFFVNMWSRIRPAGSQARETKGERF